MLFRADKKRAIRPAVIFSTAILLLISLGAPVGAVTLTNPIITQPPIPRELNGTVSNTFLSVVTIFGNQRADTAHAARGGDLWLMLTNTNLVNLTRQAGYGTNGIQHGNGIAVRDPAIHWDGRKVLFSMVVGAPTNSTDATPFFWQLYELTNLDVVIANPNTNPVIVKVQNQPTNCNNVTPCYATDGRIVFMSDKPYNGQFAALDEYKGQPTVTGTYSLDPLTGDLKLLQHTPSGAFNPFIDSSGRLIMTRWDHLSQDPLAANDRIGVSSGFEHQYGVNAVFPDCRGFLDSGDPVQHAFHVFRKDIQALRRDDHFLLATLDRQSAFGVEFPDIAGVQPAVFE